MNLIVCPSRQFGVYMLAYIKEFGLGRQFEILIPDNSEVPHQLEQMAQELGAIFVAPEVIYSKTYDELLIHSYFKFELQIPYMLSIKFKSLTFYSDGLRNGVYGLPTLDARLKKLVYFGFKLREESFESSIPQSLEGIEYEVVAFKTMEDIWHKIHELKIDKIPNLFRQTDLLLVMRYWGMPGPSYQFAENRSVLDYLREEFLDIPTFDRVIYRAHPWFDHKISKEQLQDLVGHDVEVVMWNDLFEFYKPFPEVHEPERVIYTCTDSPGLFFGFDSSLNILVSEKWPSTRIVWPNPDKFSKYFDLPRSTNIVNEQIEMMKQYGFHRRKKDVAELSVRGFEISAAITSGSGQKMHSRVLELTRERDALTQERDAIVNSKIWRLSLPVRQIINLIRGKAMVRFHSRNKA